MLNIFTLFIIIFLSFLNVDVSYADFPYVSKTSSKLKTKETKSCREYLSICENSCKERGSIFKFICIGQDFQPFEEHSFCQCADDLFRQVSQSQQLQIKKESVK